MEMTYSGKTRSAKNISQHQADAVTSRPIITGIAPIKLLGGGLWALAGFFPGVGKLGVSERKFPGGPGMELQWGSGVKPQKPTTGVKIVSN